MNANTIDEVLSLAGERDDVGRQMLVAAGWVRVATDDDGAALYAPPGRREGLRLDLAADAIVARARREREAHQGEQPIERKAQVSVGGHASTVGYDANGGEVPA